MILIWKGCWSSCTVQTPYSCTSRPDVRQCLVVQTPNNNKSWNKPITSMTKHTFASISYVQLLNHPCPENWVAIGHAVVYYARVAHAYSAEIKNRYCITLGLLLILGPVTIQFRACGKVTVRTLNFCTKRVGSPGMIHD